MARLWSCGFELQSVTAAVEFDTVSGSPTIDTTTKRSGNAALRINPSATTMSIRHQLSGGTFSSITLFTRFYIYITSYTDALDTIFRYTNGASEVMSLRMNSNGTLELWNLTSQVGSDTSALNTGQWYRIEVKIVINGSSIGTDMEVKIDGTSAVTASSQSIGAINSVAFGALTSTTCDYYIDDIAVNDSSGSFQNDYPGSGKIVHCMPNAAGDSAQWRPTSGANYTNVDEQTPNDATDIVDTQARSNNDTDDYNIESAAGLNTGDTINVVSIGVRMLRSTNNTSDTFVLRVKASSGGTVEESATLQPNSNTTWRTHANAAPRLYALTLYDLPGASTTAWSKSDIDAAQIGVRAVSTANSADAQVSTLWMLVDYTPSAGSNYSQNCNEVITITDTRINQPAKLLAETVTVVPTYINQLSRTFAEVLTIVASELNQAGKLLSESLNIRQLGANMVNESFSTNEGALTLFNDAVADGTNHYIQLTSVGTFLSGQVGKDVDLPPWLDIEFEFWSGGGTGADAVYFYIWCQDVPTGESGNGGGLAFTFDEYEDKMAIDDNGVILASTSNSGLDNSTWRKARIEIRNKDYTMYLDGVQVLTYNDTATRTYQYQKMGLGARTGGATNEHRVRNFRVDVVQPIKVTSKLQSEILTIVDTLLKNPVRTLSETLTIVDSVLAEKLGNSYSKELDEIITLAESIVKQTSRDFSETIVLTEIYSNQGGKNLAETVTVVDTNIQSVTGKTLTETTTITDTLNRASSRLLSEALTIVDSVEKQSQKIFSEAIAIVDSENSIPGKLLAETLTVTDTLVRAPLKLLSETIVIVDSFIKNPSRTITEAITIVDSVLKTPIRLFSETVTLTDTNTQKLTGFTRFETVTINDSIIRQTGKLLLETVTVVDSYLSNVGLSFTYVETVLLTDTLNRSTGRTLSETITIVDSIVRAPVKLLSETIIVVDSLLKGLPNKVLTETVVVTGSIVRQTGKVLTDSVTIVGTVLKTGGKLLSETVVVTDSITKFAAKILELTETVTLTDIVAKTTGKILSESVAVVDNFSRVLTLNKTFSETVTVVDSIVNNVTYSKILSEIITITDSLTKVGSITEVLVVLYNRSIGYQSKYSTQNTSYSDKYIDQNTSYTDKYSTQNTEYTDKYDPQTFG